MNLLNTKDMIDALLRNPKNERSRNSDVVMMANIWSRHFKDTEKIDLKSISAFDFLSRLAENSLPSYESCTRVRRKLQEKHPELRGANYKERKAEEAKVISQVMNDDEWKKVVDELYDKNS